MKKQTQSAKNLVWAMSKSSLPTKTKVYTAQVSIRANLKFSK
jgi:hypothetical protein